MHVQRQTDSSPNTVDIGMIEERECHNFAQSLVSCKCMDKATICTRGEYPALTGMRPSEIIPSGFSQHTSQRTTLPTPIIASCISGMVQVTLGMRPIKSTHLDAHHYGKQAYAWM